MWMVLGMFCNHEIFRVECGAVVAKTPGRHVLGRAAANRDDDVREKRPRVIEIILRRPRRVIGMRVVEAQQLGAQLGRAPLRLAVILRPHEKTTPRPLLGRARQRERGRDDAIAPVQRPAALVRVGLGAMAADFLIDSGAQRQRHQRALSSQNRSDRYFSPPSQNTTTITALDASRATRSAPARLAPLEMPTNSPCLASRRVSSNASSVLTPRSSSAIDSS